MAKLSAAELVLCWPVALAALVLWPLVWLLTLPFRLIGIAFDALFATLRALLFLPARLLGAASRRKPRRERAGPGTEAFDDALVAPTRPRSGLPPDRVEGSVYYNYGMTRFPNTEAPGISVFYKDDAGEVFHTYSTFGRGVEVMMGTYNLLDLVPKGRDENDGPYKTDWVRHHDRYDPAQVAGACCHANA